MHESCAIAKNDHFDVIVWAQSGFHSLGLRF